MFKLTDEERANLLTSLEDLASKPMPDDELDAVVLLVEAALKGVPRLRELAYSKVITQEYTPNEPIW